MSGLFWERIFFIQFKGGHKKKISYSLLLFLSPKKEVSIDEVISHSPKKGKGGLLTIVEDPEVV